MNQVVNKSTLTRCLVILSSAFNYGLGLYIAWMDAFSNQPHFLRDGKYIPAFIIANLVATVLLLLKSNYSDKMYRLLHSAWWFLPGLTNGLALLQGILHLYAR
jgi:hypothetical protein